MGQSLKPGEKRETGGAGQVVRCLWGIWAECMGVSSSSHTDQKGSAQGVPEGRPGTAVKGTSLGGACSVYMSGLMEAESQLCRRALVTDWEHEPGRSREFSRRLVPKAD